VRIFNLIDASKEGNLEEVRRSLSAGEDVNQQGKVRIL
jgi:hypothetical protein